LTIRLGAGRESDIEREAAGVGWGAVVRSGPEGESPVFSADRRRGQKHFDNFRIVKALGLR
jgi:hypothetical protein